MSDTERPSVDRYSNGYSISEGGECGQVSAAEATRLIDVARRAMAKAYAPYSGFRVGAAVLTTDGRVYDGANIENASYGATVCAERVAITKAVSDGCRDLLAIAVVCDGEGYARPCGVCRQVMVEFSPAMTVLMAARDGSYDSLCAADLLPHPFGLGGRAAREAPRTGRTRGDVVEGS